MNQALGRSGRLFADSYHRRELSTPREVRNAFASVLLNRRRHLAKHRKAVARAWFDEYSSAAWFEGWARPAARILEPPPVQPPRTWLARVGWTRQGFCRPRRFPERAWERNSSMTHRHEAQRTLAQLVLLGLVLPKPETRMDPIRQRIDTLLEDEALVDSVLRVLRSRRPQSARRGRPSTPAEVVLRMLVLKHPFFSCTAV